MARLIVQFRCSDCGQVSPKWLGKCPGCDAWGTLQEEMAATSQPKSAGKASPVSAPAPLTRLKDAASQTGALERLHTGVAEFDRVLGGGLVPGSVVLVGGEPGIGKSTLLTQAAASIARSHGHALYVSGEESASQISRRLTRLKIPRDTAISICTVTDVRAVEAAIRAESPSFAVIDSIQTLAYPENESMAGSVWQVRSCAEVLSHMARDLAIPVCLVGHVTKDGSLAGPRVLEHLVDTVLSFEGDRRSQIRLLRASKNRFGATDEIGVFEMLEHGLVEVANPSELFLSERPLETIGSAVTSVMEGSRPLLVEVQALVAPSVLANPRRTVTGYDTGRTHMILAVLEKRAGIALGFSDVYVNVVGGMRIDEPAADLALAIAVASHSRDMPVDPLTVALGEIGLAGEVRAVSNIATRIREASRLGFRRAIVSERNRTQLHSLSSASIEIVVARNVRDAIGAALDRK